MPQRETLKDPRSLGEDTCMQQKQRERSKGNHTSQVSELEPRTGRGGEVRGEVRYISNGVGVSNHI